MAEIEILNKIFEFCYERALIGLPGIENAQELAVEFLLKKDGTLLEKSKALVDQQITKCATAGFLTSFGGFPLLALTLPANLSSVLFLQVRMVAAIAHMAGYNLRDDKVKKLVLACILGTIAREGVRGFGIKFAQKKLTGRGLINLGKAVPVVGGIVGGIVDGASCRIVGNFAIKSFISSG